MSWSNQGGDVGKLACAVMLPRPGRRLRFKSRRPSLTLDYGSIRARALAAGAKVREFGVSLFPIARSRNQVKLVDALRSSATGERLPRVESLRAADLEGKEGVVIFLHGLMSTDVGTFDAFIHRLQANNKLLLTSWPHDTLDRIELNAKMLAEHIQRRIGKSGLPLMFVCHSRGGLVARRTAVQLLNASDVWRSRLRGCVTFGTPHEGAELAEKANQLLGKLLLLRTVQPAGATPLVRALQTVRQFKTLPGITDLRPRKNGGDFLDRLMEAEKRAHRRTGHHSDAGLCGRRTGGIEWRDGMADEPFLRRRAARPGGGAGLERPRAHGVAGRGDQRSLQLFRRAGDGPQRERLDAGGGVRHERVSAG